MLKRIKYTVKIKVPAKTLEQDLTFENGMTGITGPNGKGKSMVLEMIQLAYWGNDALRGKMDDYESITMEHEFMLKGEDYRVYRTKGDAKLWVSFADDWKPLASGSKAVNIKMAELFGYSADVFRMANVCNQGKIEELGEMKPGERKRLVDETIGLNVLDDIMLFIDGKRKDLNTTINAVEGMLTEPVKPEDPLLPYSAEQYKVQKDRLTDERQRRTLWQIAAGKDLSKPIEPLLDDNDQWREAYVVETERRKVVSTEMYVLGAELARLPTAPVTMVTKLEQDDGNMRAYLDFISDAERLDTEISVNERGLLRHKWTEPVISMEQVEAYSARNKLVDRWEQKAKLRAKNVPHDCPKCQHHWEDEDPRIKSEFGDVPDERPEVLMSQSNIDAALINRRNWEAATPIELHIAELKERRNKIDVTMFRERVTAINTTRQRFHESLAASQAQERKQELEAKLAALKNELDGLTDRTRDIQRIDIAREHYRRYEMLKGIYEKELVTVQEAKIELAKFPENLDKLIGDCEHFYVLALTYENNLAHYINVKATYDTAMEQVQKLKAELEEWTAARGAVGDVRAKVKGYLLPSLNTVASILINQMTGGELSSVLVNDQFEITVDRQRIETLSGAGKSVANLALRIGLGQVLTNRVFSVMMLDEIDASCDDTRAKYIAECLMNLTKTIGQVVQVSHKAGLVADHHVRL